MALTKLPQNAFGTGSVDSDKIEDGTIQNVELSGSLANDRLANSSITINGTSTALGGSVTIEPFVEWQSVITADGSTTTTAVASEGYFIDTTSASHTINLPVSASTGDTIAIKDYAGTFGSNNLTIGRNGHNIQGVANDSLISTNRASLVLVYVDSTKGWLYTDEHNVADLQAPFYISASGGTETTDGDFKIHSFTGDGCFVVSSLGGGGVPCAQASTVDYLVVAGGGGSGGGIGGGGGAGGFRESKDSTLSSPHTASPLAATSGLTVTATTYPVTVGAGGAAGGQGNPGTTGVQGSNSVFSTITSTGGGGGGAWGSPSYTADTGGSGGGGGAEGSQSGASGNTPPVSPPQGNNGGSGLYDGSNPQRAGGGGGGGATAAGAGVPSPNSNKLGGNGGNGATTSISGSSSSYAGGGAGGGLNQDSSSPTAGASGGLGGGGDAGDAPNGVGVAGTANTGGGGGASQYTSSYPPSGAGGKGIVVIRYKYQ